MERYYQPAIETASRDQLLAWQNERLVRQVQHIWDHVPYYRKKMEEKGVAPGEIQGVEDLHKLPLLTKDDLREAYPYGLLGMPLKDCTRIQSTSGTTGRRVVAFYTQHDIDLWEDCCARAIVAAGGTDEDVCHVSYGYGLFTGGPGLNGGSHKVGCLTLTWAPPSCAAPPPMRPIWPRASTSGDCGTRSSSRRAFSAPRHGARRCAGISSPSWASRPMTSTA